jgi:hypothetical protein
VAEPRFGERLEQLWDAVRRGDPAAASADPSLAETLRLLHAHDRVPPPDPAFVAAVRPELMSAATVPVVAGDAARVPNGRIAPGPWQLWPHIPAGAPARRGWVLAQAATALLIALTLLAAYFAFGPGRPQPADVPAIEPTAAATPESGMTVMPLGSGVADALPEDLALLWMYHTSYRPGGRVGLEVAEGPSLIAVESGALTYHADRPLVVTRAAAGGAAGRREEIPANTPFALRGGDSAVVPLGARISRENEGAESAVELGTVLKGTLLGYRGRGGPTGVVDLPIVTFHISDAHVLPLAPVRITLDRIILAPGVRFTPPSAAWWMVGTPEPAYPNLERQADGAAVNSGPDPIDLYLTTVEPLSEGLPP